MITISFSRHAECLFNEKAVAYICIYIYASAMYIRKMQSFQSYRMPELTLFIMFYISVDIYFYQFWQWRVEYSLA